MVEKNQTTILIHVDDLMIASTDQSCIDEVIMGLNTEYAKENVHDGQVIDYLDMLFNGKYD